ncbi:MAG: chemotaxis protein CheA, partial [Sphingomonas sp.]
SAVHDHEELVVKPAAPGVMATGLYAGATLPDDNRPMLLLDAAGVAQAAGIAALSAAIGQEPEPIEAAPAVAPFPALLFRGLDGVERAVRLSLVERIEDMAADAIGFAAGRLRVTHGEVLLPLFGGPVASDVMRVRILQMSDGDTTLAYAVESVSDIVEIAAPLAAADAPGPIAGAVRVNDRTLELIDGHWLFAEAARAGAPQARRPLALLADGGTRWSREVLRPLVEQAGYRVAFAGEDEAAEADVVLAGCDDPVAAWPAAPVVRLRASERAETDDGSIWRYDRAGLSAALGRHRAAARGARR